ncbi:MAG: hypothetical protein V7K67_31380 [Nostoc sp.]|uniref:hypothetical protein n=1 Tax=Nostoc sp. TaxID=1180 RepID=UPI002FFD32B7
MNQQVLTPRSILLDAWWSGGNIGEGDAEIIAQAISTWKHGAGAIIYYSVPFGMSGEQFRRTVKPVADASVHDAFISGRQVFVVNMMGDWRAYPDLEKPECPKGYWWMSILWERSTLVVYVLAPSCWRRRYA